ncbi:MAG: FAD-binding oxidoreductase [Burkholderiales bacterium]|nr:FAD-binding oxidoreductase [Burkholderiales bacterium]OJX08385.1 MAG: FAD-dependent oxidoreductase [Burkholderiales bacterium 70-64]
MTQEQRYDHVIVGAGIAGSSLAYRLAGHARVLVLEQEAQPGYHATGRSAAMFMASYGTQAIRALTRASRAFYERPPAGFADHPLMTPRGVIYLAGPDDAQRLAQTYDELSAAAPEVSRIEAHEILRRVPVLRPERILGGILEADAQDIDVHALHQGFLHGMRRQGGELRTRARLIQGRRAGDHWRLTLADGGVLLAGTVIDAAGAWADEVARACAVAPIGLEPRRRSAFTFDGPPDLDFHAWPVVCGIREDYYFKPDAGQLLGSPANADPTVPHDVVPEELDIATGIHQIQEVSRMTIRRPRHTWAGLRSFVADGDLVIGWDVAVEGFFWLAAQGGYGIQTAAAASELAAALVLGGPLPGHLKLYGVEATAFSPARLRRPSPSIPPSVST